MKKIFVMLALGVVISGTVRAQDGSRSDRKARLENRQGQREKKSPEEIATRQTAMLDQKLDLSSRQERKVQEINLKRAQEIQALRGHYAGAPEDGRQAKAGGQPEIKAINERWENELKDILSKKQYGQYEAAREEMRNRRVARREQDGDKMQKRKEWRRQQKDNG